MKRILAISLGLMHFAPLYTNNNLIFRNNKKTELPLPILQSKEDFFPLELPTIVPDPKPEEVVGVDWPSENQVTEVIDWSAPVEIPHTPEPTPELYVYEEPIVENTYTWGGQQLSPSAGVVQGPSGTERYYNLDMSGVVNIARNQGIEGDYWVRDDGVKMYGNYIICACGFDVRPRGTVVETSLGAGICLDTGGFAYSDPYMIDIAVTW